MIKKLFIDTETTGTNSKTCAIHQLAGCIEIDGEVKEYFDIKMQPFKGAEIDKYALEVSHVSIEEIFNYDDNQFEGYLAFRRLLEQYVDKFNPQDKFFIIGYNVQFDIGFLYEFFKRQGDNYLFSLCWGNHIDIETLATEKLIEKRHLMSDFKLMTVAKELNIIIEEEKLHNAEYDIFITRECYYKLK